MSEKSATHQVRSRKGETRASVVQQPPSPGNGGTAGAPMRPATAAWAGVLTIALLVIAVLVRRLRVQKRLFASVNAFSEVQKTDFRRAQQHLETRNAELLRGNAELTRKNSDLRAENARLLKAPPRKKEEERTDERLSKQMEAVLREHVQFSRRRVMNRGELAMFYAALNVTRQPKPAEPYPFYVFPQVSLGQILGAEAPQEWQAAQAHRAINSKRCDLLLTDRQGTPVMVLEYQGEGHDLDGTATRRDQIKRFAVEGAGVQFVEFEAEVSLQEMQRRIAELLKQHLHKLHGAAMGR